MNEHRDISFYIDKACENAGIKSNRKLGLALGKSEFLITQLKCGRAFPSDDVMIKLAELAGVDPYIALIDLNSWRSEGAARNAYKEILKRISAITTVFLIGISAAPAKANVNIEYCYYGNATVYYGKYHQRFFKILFDKVFSWTKTILSHGRSTQRYTFAE